MIARFRALSLPMRGLFGLGLVALATSAIVLYWSAVPACNNIFVHVVTDLKPVCREYWEAVQDASDPKPSETSQKLRAVTKSDNTLRWSGENGNRQVLVVNWATGREFDKG